MKKCRPRYVSKKHGGGEFLNVPVARMSKPEGDVMSVQLTEFGSRKTLGRIALWEKRKEDSQ
ncbi:MAG: hypothetical protein E6K95_01135 [Thaumarchaeota archaeon]|nr:MAG: hypothetical protein E6K90_01240 [Nitrososphaerota archaeon]TLY05724.1 MAG: hypothetical protein E6K95_01135 [Nitrososphaerota archaeon]TLY12723.1 MAG: hypothetical protein E6K86_11080 [Nitrososphaerota archaeon]TLY14075.1 MAG: hypothetical protein E6K84_03065 [Nitrososphaerota archaeon]TMP99718.1 MAG: hypothetical protein E6K99_04055 [Nitrososphaerota archaeon]